MRFQIPSDMTEGKFDSGKQENHPVPQWQIDEVLNRKEYYRQHPEELIEWGDAMKMLTTG